MKTFRPRGGRGKGAGTPLVEEGAEVKADDAQIDALRSENLMESVHLSPFPSLARSEVHQRR